jgi:hypothetical protein
MFCHKTSTLLMAFRTLAEASLRIPTWWQTRPLPKIIEGMLM